MQDYIPQRMVNFMYIMPGADIDSDHNLLVAKLRTMLKKIIRIQNSKPRWDLEKLSA